MPRTKKDFGDWGESQAVRFLTQRNYEILDRNYHKQNGEIDIIASLKDKIHFIEVKTRKISGIEKYGDPEAAVNFFKKKKLIQTAYLYLNQKEFPGDTDWQIDVISIIYLPEEKKVHIKHIQNAFDENDI